VRVAGFMPVGAGRDQALSAIAETLAGTDPERAELIAQSIQDPVCRASPLMQVALSLSDQHEAWQPISAYAENALLTM